MQRPTQRRAMSAMRLLRSYDSSGPMRKRKERRPSVTN
jgi:hypothetical protein